MFSRNKKVSAAESLIFSQKKIAEATQKEIRGLQRAAEERVAGETALRDAEAAMSLGEAADTAEAEKRLQQASAEIERRARIVAGLRHKLVSNSAGLEICHADLKGSLAEHINKLRADFTNEWERASAAFGQVLGKRVELEKLVGALDLADAKPLACELPEGTSAPWRALDGLSACLREIAEMSNPGVWAAVDEMTPGGARFFDPHAIYVSANALSGFEVGQLLIEAMFPPRALEHLHNIGYAHRADLNAFETSTSAASAAARGIAHRALQEEIDSTAPKAAPAMDESVLEKSREAARQLQRYVDPDVARFSRASESGPLGQLGE